MRTKFDQVKLKQLIRKCDDLQSMNNNNSTRLSIQHECKTKIKKNHDDVESVNDGDSKSKKRKKSKKKKSKHNIEKSERRKKTSKERNKSWRGRKKHKKRISSRSPTASTRKRKHRSPLSSTNSKCVDDGKHQRKRKNSNVLSPSNRQSKHKSRRQLYNGSSACANRKKNRASKRQSSSVESENKIQIRSRTHSKHDYLREDTGKRSRSHDEKLTKSKSEMRKSEACATPTPNTHRLKIEKADSRKLYSFEMKRPSQSCALARVNSLSLKYDEEEDDSDVDLPSLLDRDSLRNSSAIDMEIIVKLKSTKRSIESKTNQDMGITDAAKREEITFSPLNRSPIESYPQRYLEILPDMPKKSHLDEARTILKMNGEPMKNANVSDGECVLTSTSLHTKNMLGLRCGNLSRAFEEVEQSKQDESASQTHSMIAETRLSCDPRSSSKSRSNQSSSSRSSHKSRENSVSDSDSSLSCGLTLRKLKRKRRSYSSSSEESRSSYSSSYGSRCNSLSPRNGRRKAKKRSSNSRSSYSSVSSSSSSSRSRSRSLSIPRRRGSPSFLDRRRITSARKRPIIYKRSSVLRSLSSSSRSSSRSSYTSSVSSSPLSRRSRASLSLSRDSSRSPMVGHDDL